MLVCTYHNSWGLRTRRANSTPSYDMLQTKVSHYSSKNTILVQAMGKIDAPFFPIFYWCFSTIPPFWVLPKIRDTPKWMVKKWKTPYFLMDDLGGGTPYFWKTPHVQPTPGQRWGRCFEGTFSRPGGGDGNILVNHLYDLAHCFQNDGKATPDMGETNSSQVSPVSRWKNGEWMVVCEL